jgi:hypothetical protein
MGKSHTSLDEGVEVWGMEERCSECMQTVGSMVVCMNMENVRLRGVSLNNRRQKNDRDQETELGEMCHSL